MKSHSINVIKNNYLVFANTAEPFLHIEDKNHYEQALMLLELLLQESSDDIHHPLNGLIGLISHAIEAYESKQNNLQKFKKEVDNERADISLLRVLIEQHQLTLSDFPEIGDKTLLSKILSGKRNLTKKHIEKLAKRFDIDPGLFF